MKYHRCGAEMEHISADLPFKVRENSIVIIKNLPCGSVATAASIFSMMG